ncbi:MAG: hypothetical protein U0271_20845 [Polyangiaceae bacterium]
MDSLAGRWEGRDVVLELGAVQGDRVAGVLLIDHSAYPVRGVVAGGALTAGFESDGALYSLTAKLVDGELVVESDGEVFRLSKSTVKRGNPLTGRTAGAPPATAQPAAQPAAPPPKTEPAAHPPWDDGSTTYRHPTGGEMRLPRGWQVTQTQLGLELIPPDRAYTPRGPAEVYLVAAQAAPGVTRPDEPLVLARVDGLLRQVIPTLGPPGAPTASGDGIRVLWAGRDPMTGNPISAVAYLRLVDGALAGIIGAGEQQRIDVRLEGLAAIFLSFRKGEGRRDPALVGTWHSWTFRASSSMISGGSTSHETRKVIHLGADGVVRERANYEGAGNFRGKDSYGDPSWSAGYASQSNDERTGNWTAGDGMFYLTWSDGGGGAWPYQIVGAPGSRRVVLGAPGAKNPIEWTERPITF